MSEGNGVRAWNDRAALFRHGCAVLVVAFIAGGVYVALDLRVQAADDRGKDNAKAIEKLTENVNALSVGQQLLNQSVINDRQNNADFRTRTDDALRDIIRKLDRAERRDSGKEGR